MTDPFSGASGAIGVVSLGLTVCQGLISYCSDFKGQNKYLDDLTSKAEGLNSCLILLNHGLPAWGAQTPDTTQQVDQIINDCKPRILFLESRLAKLQRTQGPSIHRDKIQNYAQQAVFAFRKNGLTELSGMIDALQHNLDTILSVANLEASSTLAGTQHAIGARVDVIVAGSTIIRSGVQKASHELSCVRNDLSNIHGELRSVRSTIDPGLQMIMQRVDSLGDQIARSQGAPTSSQSSVQHTQF